MLSPLWFPIIIAVFATLAGILIGALFGGIGCVLVGISLFIAAIVCLFKSTLLVAFSLLEAGNLEWDSLTTDSLILDAGAGSITLSNVSAATTDVNLGAGIIDLNDCTLQNATFEVGMGELNYSGVIRGDLTADCGMGSLTFAFIDSEQKHNYSLDGSMGSISIGDKGYGGMAYEKTLNNNASSNYELSCSMGNITVTFED